MRWLCLSPGLLLPFAFAADDKKTPPPFFLQDPTDSLCLAGEEFKRCSIDTLFYVVGSPGKCTNIAMNSTADDMNVNISYS
jgi:hypothetical protein